MSKTEAQTRKEIIDKRLKQAGWNVNNLTEVVCEFDIEVELPNGVNEPQTPYQGHRFCDYVLLGRNGKPLAVVEAKKTSKDAAIGREQAKQYAYNIKDKYTSELPFCFYTNGYDIFFWDLENYPPRKIFGFPNKEDLERFRYIHSHKRPLAQELINTNIAGRDYQIKAIRSLMEGIEEKKRRFLLVMATGTGKTRTVIGFIDAIMRAGWAEKILFLVDRIALREQALDAFKEHLPNEPRFPKPDDVKFNENRRIYVYTYPAMLNLIKNDEFDISPHFFDLIVVDESHRSIYNVYQEIIDYFNAITIGLTATPTDIIDHNTFELFDCESGLPDFAYSYDEALNSIPPYLCDFQVMKIHTKFQEEGINKRTITLEDQKKLILEGKDIEEINYEGTEIEKTVINKGTNVLIVKEFMEECIKDKNGVLPGKTIFFCMSINHARRIEQIFDNLYPEYKGELVKVIVSDDPRVYGKNGLLDQFKNLDMPRIAISVGMLDTGIDILEIVNLVFAKPVFSYTRFWQMIGRGTRLLEEKKIKPWCTEKDVFLILDCWDNFEYFKLKPKGKELPPQIPLPVKLFGIRLEKVEQAIEKNNSDIAQKEIKLLQRQIQMLPEKSTVILDANSELEKVNDPNFWNHLNHEKFEFLHKIIKPLMRTISNEDFKAMSFERNVLETSLAFLKDEEEKFKTLKDVVVEKISELPLSINTVAKEAELIEKAQTNNFWAEIEEAKFDQLIEKLALLMKYRDTGVKLLPPVKFNLKDTTSKKEFVEFGPKHEAISIAKYREMVEAKILEMTRTNLVLQKLKAGYSITEDEIKTLADKLHEEDPYITENLLQRVYDNKKAHFIEFIKHILGIEILHTFKETVAEEFLTFISQHTNLTSKQLQFLDILKSYIIEKGDIQKKDLIQAPFTTLHPDGIRGVFKPDEIEEILVLTQKLVA